MSKFKIEADSAIILLERAIKHLEKVDGIIASDPKQHTSNSARNASISKELLFIAHLCKKAETLVLDEYHSFKGESDQYTR